MGISETHGKRASHPKIGFKRTDCQHPDFRRLVVHLNTDLKKRDGKDHVFYNQFNGISEIRHALVAYDKNIPLGCGAIKVFDPKTMEIKRMYVVPNARKKGIGYGILRELERWTAELGFSRCVLETGKRQPEAIALYKKSGYSVIPNFGPYQGVDNSVCFEKNVSSVKTKTQ